MYFTDRVHQTNFERLAGKFPQTATNSEYRAACYIAALPEICKCFNVEKQENGPFDWYFECILEGESKTGSTAPLTNRTTQLVELALNLWNGRPFDLAEGIASWDDDLYRMAMQAIDLRRNQPCLRFAGRGQLAQKMLL